MSQEDAQDSDLEVGQGIEEESQGEGSSLTEGEGDTETEPQDPVEELRQRSDRIFERGRGQLGGLHRRYQAAYRVAAGLLEVSKKLFPDRFPDDLHQRADEWNTRIEEGLTHLGSAMDSAQSRVQPWIEDISRLSATEKTQAVSAVNGVLDRVGQWIDDTVQSTRRLIMDRVFQRPREWAPTADLHDDEDKSEKNQNE